jgi:hypothetical protein
VATTGYFSSSAVYEVSLDGAASGTIGANDALTIEGVEAGPHSVGLRGLDAACEDPGVLAVDVPAGEMGSFELDIVCSYERPVRYTLAYETSEIDLDAGVVNDDCCSDKVYDFHFAYRFLARYHAVVFQHKKGRKIAHLPDVVFEDLTRDDVAGASFTTSHVETTFDPDRVILITTDQGDVYALGNPVELSNFTVRFEAARLPDP